MRTCLLVFVAVLSVAPPVWAWGPHTEITRAALATLPEQAAIRSLLGKDLAALEKTCWLPDGRRGARGDFFPNDYLLFPASPREREHLNPDVRQTYEPFFRRAVQAVRTESPHNAARWIGSLLHYVQDTGAPPHAAAITGELHLRMENWLDAEAIRIDGYRPQVLGADESSALKGLLRRLEQLSAFAVERAEQMRQPLAALQERQNQPLSLECALEAARVSADVLLTLSELSTSTAGGATLNGAISGADTSYFPQVAARVMLLGTDYSTGSQRGRFAFRNLPPGRYRLAVLRPGNTLWTGEVELSPERPTTVDVALAPSTPPGNRLRNAEFVLRWVDPAAPDCWRPLTVGYPDKPAPEPGWQSEIVQAKAGARYRVGAEPLGESRVTIAVRWRELEMSFRNVREVRLDDPSGGMLTAPEGARYLQILILTADDPAKVCRRVWCVEVE